MEPIPADLLADWAESDLNTIQTVLSSLDPVLSVEQRPQGLFYFITSAEFRSFLQTPDAQDAAGITLKEANTLIAENMASKINFEDEL